jgi:hypothetical protein
MMSAVPLLDLLLALPEPHPELVAASRPMAEAMFTLGLLPHDDDRLFRPAAVG